MILGSFICNPFTCLVPVYFEFNLIQEDSDDNKFVDCAIFANADFIVSDDKHFNELGSVEFPKVLVVRLDDFARLFRKALNQ